MNRDGQLGWWEKKNYSISARCLNVSLSSEKVCTSLWLFYVELIHFCPFFRHILNINTLLTVFQLKKPLCRACMVPKSWSCHWWGRMRGKQKKRQDSVKKRSGWLGVEVVIARSHYGTKIKFRCSKTRDESQIFNLEKALSVEGTGWSANGISHSEPC